MATTPILVRSTSFTHTFPMFWSAGGLANTLAASSITLRVSKDGGDFAAASGSITVSNDVGWFKITFTATETDCMVLRFYATAAGCATTPETFYFKGPIDVVNVTGNVTGSVGSVTGNVGGNVVGSVASVTGAVGSVTGNVGGNVTGSVASVVGNVGGNVTGSVGSVAGNVTGSVASVVGNVGGNITGSVASVVGDINGKVIGGGSGTITGVGARVQDSGGSDVAKETGGNISAIKTKTDNLPADTEESLELIQNSITDISNVVRLSVSICDSYTIPDSGNTFARIEVAIKDDAGSMMDPDGNQLAINSYSQIRESCNARLYKDVLGASLLDDATGTFSPDFKKLVRDDVGMYYFYLKISSTDVPICLTLRFGWEETGTALYEFRNTDLEISTPTSGFGISIG